MYSEEDFIAYEKMRQDFIPGTANNKNKKFEKQLTGSEEYLCEKLAKYDVSRGNFVAWLKDHQSWEIESALEKAIEKKGFGDNQAIGKYMAGILKTKDKLANSGASKEAKKEITFAAEAEEGIKEPASSPLLPKRVIIEQPNKLVKIRAEEKLVRENLSFMRNEINKARANSFNLQNKAPRSDDRNAR